MANTELSKRIKELRLKRGMSQEQLADISGLSLRTVQRVESGQNIPRGDTLSRLASAFQVSTEEITELQNIEDDQYSPTGKGLTNFFDNWKRLIYIYFLSVFILSIGIYFNNILIGWTWLFVCVIELLILSYSIIYQFSKKRWMAGVLTSLIVLISLLLFIGMYTPREHKRVEVDMSTSNIK